MRLWPMAMGGLIVWAAHFFTLYALGSVFETTAPARIGTLAATVLAVAADLWLIARARRSYRDGLVRWVGGLAQGGALLSIVAVIWQGLVAALV